MVAHLSNCSLVTILEAKPRLAL